MEVLSLALGLAAGGALGYLPSRLRRRPAAAAPAAEPDPVARPDPVVVVVERVPEAVTPVPPPAPEPAAPVTSPDALELLKERDRRLTADAKLRLVRE